MNYNPITLSIYGDKNSKFHLKYKNNAGNVVEKVVDSIAGHGEFNDKIFNILYDLENNQVNINRPFLIFGNYSPTGESLTFVNYKYATNLHTNIHGTCTIRSAIRLLHISRETGYQFGCRINYITNKFETIKGWNGPPDKYLVGSTKFITHVLGYEQTNDKHIDQLLEQEPNYNVEYDDININRSLLINNQKKIIEYRLKTFREIITKSGEDEDEQEMNEMEMENEFIKAKKWVISMFNVKNGPQKPKNNHISSKPGFYSLKYKRNYKIWSMAELENPNDKNALHRGRNNNEYKFFPAYININNNKTLIWVIIYDKDKVKQDQATTTVTNNS